MTNEKNIWHPYAVIDDPILSFHIEQPYRSRSKVEGLFKWGPLDSNSPLRPQNPIRVATIVNKRSKDQFVNYLMTLNRRIEATDLYLLPFKGFHDIYGCNLQLNDFETIDNEEINACNSEQDVLDLYVRKISACKAQYQFDVLFLFVPREFEKWIEVRKERYFFHLHDKIKLYASAENIRTQVFREIRIPNTRSEKSLLRHMWWLSGAIYTKAGGSLYRLAQFDERILYIGLAYAIVPFQISQRVLIGVAQLFDEQGNDVIIDLFSTTDFTEYSRNPYLKESASRQIFQRILEIYRRAKMQLPSKIIVHKTTPFNDDEIRGIRQSCSAVSRLELLFIQVSNPYRAIRLRNRTAAHNFPILRGTAVRLDEYSFLLWTAGDIHVKSEGRELSYYQEKRHIPTPLLVTRFNGSDTLEEVATDIMKLTKMNWNNLQYYNKLPVTVDFAGRIARISKQAEDFPGDRLPVDFRFYI